jgi:hypothetical protein
MPMTNGQGIAMHLGDGHLGHVPEVHVDVGNLLHAGADVHGQTAALQVFARELASNGVGASERGQIVACGEGVMRATRSSVPT